MVDSALRKGSWITIIFLIVFYLTTQITTTLQCIPIEGNWDITGAVKKKCINTVVYFYGTCWWFPIFQHHLICWYSRGCNQYRGRYMDTASSHQDPEKYQTIQEGQGRALCHLWRRWIFLHKQHHSALYHQSICYVWRSLFWRCAHQHLVNDRNQRCSCLCFCAR